MERCHDKLECPSCGSIFPNMECLEKHKKKHVGKHKTDQASYQGNGYQFKCTICSVAFKNHEDMMDHLSNVHLSETQRKGAGLSKNKYVNGISERDDRPPSCNNGDDCRFHRQHRCNFYHSIPPQARQVRRPRQAPSSQ